MANSGRGGTPRVLGLTGPIACGKSTVGDLLLGLGALERIDADAIVRHLQMPGTEITGQIVADFGPDILTPNGAIDRRALAEIVFADTVARERLERFIYPAVSTTIRRRLARLACETGVVVVDAVRLLESDLVGLCDAVWVVVCQSTEQRRRLTEDRRMADIDAQNRIDAQPPFEHPSVTVVIDNSGSKVELAEKVRRLWCQQLPGADNACQCSDRGAPEGVQ